MYDSGWPIMLYQDNPCLVYELLSPGEMGQYVPSCAWEVYSQPNQVAVELYDIESYPLLGITATWDNLHRPQLHLPQHPNLITWDKVLGHDNDSNPIWYGVIAVPFGTGVISCQVTSIPCGGWVLVMNRDVATVIASKLDMQAV